MEDIPTKQCSKCGEELPLINFSKSKYGKDGIRSYCKKCASIEGKLRAEKLKEKNFTTEIDYSKTKVCSKCGEEKTLNNFAIRSDSATGFRDQCKSCTNNNSLDYYYNNTDRCKFFKRRWKKNNKERVREVDKIWILNNKERRRSIDKRSYDNSSINLKDSYVIKMLKYQGFSSDQITQEIIETKRLIIKIKRKTQQNESKKS